MRRSAWLLGVLLALATVGGCGSSHQVAAPRPTFIRVGLSAGSGGGLSWTKQFRLFATPNAKCEIDFKEQNSSLGRANHHIPETTYLYCDHYIAAHPRQSISVGMDAAGRIRLLCHTDSCTEDDAIPDRILRLGGSANLGPFRCSVVSAGTRCVIEKTGRGFLIGAHRVTLDLS